MAVKRSPTGRVGLHGSHVRRRSNSPANKPPHFFKIILPSTIDDEKLMIPVKFIRRFGDELSAKATINVPNGRTWQVGIDKDHKVNTNIWFCDGWQEFMEYYSIQYGYFLVFRYEGNSNFLVSIFDKSACEIDYPCMDQSNEVDPILLESSSEEHEQGNKDDDGDGDEMLDSGTSPQSRVDTNNLSKGGQLKESESPHQPDSLPKAEFYVSTKFVYSKKSESAIHTARKNRPKNPSFMVVLKEGMLRTQLLTIHSEFVKKYMLRCSELIILQDSSGRQQPAKLYCYDKSSSVKKIGKGLGAFFKDNNAKEGDVCVFELINKKDIVLKIWLYPVDEDSGNVEILNSKAPMQSRVNMNISKSEDSELSHQYDSLPKEDDQKVFVSRSLVYSKKSASAIRAARNQKPQNPSFMVVLRPSNLCGFSLLVPSEFVKKYMWNCSELIRLKDSSGNQWPVMCDFYNSSTSSKRITKGLGAFFADNDLKEGDVCVFELMKNKDVLLNVWIYHVDDEEKTTDDDDHYDNGNDNGDIEILDFKAPHQSGVNTNISKKDKLREIEMPHQHESLPIEDESSIFRCKKFQYSKESESAVHAAIKNEPQNPSFMVVIRQGNLDNSFLLVPFDFAKKYMWRCSEQIRLQDSSGKKWPVNCHLNPLSTTSMRLGKGLGAFF